MTDDFNSAAPSAPPDGGARDVASGDQDALARPLCVDLDGTLIRSDTLIEGVVSLLTQRGPVRGLVPLLATTRAGFKRNVATQSPLAAQQLPLNPQLVAFIKQEKDRGRRIVLATAADENAARAIAEHTGLFDEVIASDGVVNLKGEAKAAELVRRFGHRGFDYAGDSRADLAVWREAHGIVIVNAAPAVAREARSLGRVVAEFDPRPSIWKPAVRAMRPHQWVKNLLVFVPLLTSRAFFDWPGSVGALAIFVSFCFTASGLYIVNDILDVASDRQHSRKRRRPLADGSLPLAAGIVLAGVLVSVGGALALWTGAASLVALYAAISFTYSVALKTYPLLDVFVLAALYTLRIVAGGAASGHFVTTWLLAFSAFTFLSLALVKRVGEIVALQASNSKAQGVTRRGYKADDAPILRSFGVASAFVSSVVLALFVSTIAVQQYSWPELLWLLVPLILFWQLRLWLATERGLMHDDPIVYASRDWVSWQVAASVVGIVVLASVGPLW